MRRFRSGSRTVSDQARPYIIAEVGVNHGGSLAKARELIALAKEGGADAVKFQTYKAGTLASKNSPSYWDLDKEPTASQYELFKKYDSFTRKEYIALSRYARDLRIDFLSTPFDDDAVDFLADRMPCFKIASADITNAPFLRKIASKKMPVILSTGASTLEEIAAAVRILDGGGVKDIALLHCILNYPTAWKDANLNMIKGLLKAFPERVIGYSDHCLPDDSMTVLTTAYLLGARIIEKHFTDDKSLPGNDHYHAMDIRDLKRFIKQLEMVRSLEGAEHKAPIHGEEIARRNARRSIVTVRRIKAGQVLTENSITYKRPGTGISPLYWRDVVGMKALSELKEDHVLQWKDLESSTACKRISDD